MINLAGLDSIVHAPIRLAVLTYLNAKSPNDFSTLRTLLGATDGALGTHLHKLESHGYIECRKSFVERRPRSRYAITPEGRRALARHIETLAEIVDLVREASPSAEDPLLD